MSEILQVFESAYEYVSDDWTQRHLARDEDGISCSPVSDAAVCWCAEGALHAGIFETKGHVDKQLLKTCMKELREVLQLPKSVKIWQWNDSELRRHEEVLTAFHRVILRKRGV